MTTLRCVCRCRGETDLVEDSTLDPSYPPPVAIAYRRFLLGPRDRATFEAFVAEHAGHGGVVIVVPRGNVAATPAPATPSPSAPLGESRLEDLRHDHGENGVTAESPAADSTPPDTV